VGVGGGGGGASSAFGAPALAFGPRLTLMWPNPTVPPPPPPPHPPHPPPKVDAFIREVQGLPPRPPPPAPPPPPHAGGPPPGGRPAARKRGVQFDDSDDFDEDYEDSESD
jgi:hypothetical protein